MNMIKTTKLPLIVAPMFLVSSPELVIASSEQGVIGSLPAPNARTPEILDQWLAQISERLNPRQLPWLLNMIVHSTYDRFAAEIELVRKYQPSVVSTALGSPTRVMEVVKGYGGEVIADVITPAMAKKAVAAGVDGLILVVHGAGGHTGLYNPLAFIQEVREFWEGPLGVAGCVSHGRDILAMQVAGADFVVSGTRFIAASESFASADYKQMLVDSHIEDIVESKAVSGVAANWMRASLERAQIDPKAESKAQIDFSGNISSANKAWKDVWSAGQGAGSIHQVQSAAEILAGMQREYRHALAQFNQFSTEYLKHDG
ncbi:NAD(P)H-dependent flavin oxidoreductase [Nitrincola tapanii]|uniref:Nitronate monooxygenase n=1 Tax=Nitrincola tapanii TaxID=1708751 RepID=A0A5A9W195_9GAMM|nr:nitronate monooxygenase [Nitrincola tapanii]KAA0873989.1 nitronate monooxygenase [Nitrincola tapanii]